MCLTSRAWARSGAKACRTGSPFELRFVRVSAGIPAEHDVQLYDRDSSLVETVAAHLGAGIAADEGALAIATPEHAAALRERLGGLGHDVEALEAADRLLFADAEETLSAIVGAAGVPSMVRFERAVLPPLNRISDPGACPHLFGEMVDLLWRGGDRAGAEALEDLWHQFETRRDFRLLCAYSVADVFDRSLHLELVPHLWRTHREVRLVAEPSRLRHAFDQALAEALGPGDAARVYELATARRPDAWAPAHQLALTWMSAHMPQAAEQILAVARERYASASSTTKVAPSPGADLTVSEPPMRVTSSRQM